MDNFDYQAYLKSGKIHGESKQVISESQKVAEKKEDVDESAPGYKHDCAAHVMHESHGFGLCLEGRHTLVETTEGHAEVTHYDVMFKNGNIIEKIPVNELKVLTSEAHSHGKEEELEEVGKGYFKKEHGIGKKELEETIVEAKAKIDEGSYPFDQCLADNEGKYGQKGAARVCGAIKAAYGEGLVNENKRTDAEQEGYKDGFEDAKDDIEAELKKMKVSELKAKIREDIIEFLSEQEEDVDVDVDIEDEAEVDVDAEGDNINIKKTGVKADVEVGLSPVEELVQDSLQAAMKASEGLGDDVLTDQIGNTITYFTRKFVVGNKTD